MLLALIFIVLGITFLLRNLGIISGDVWGIIWPVILILIGFDILRKTHEFHKWKVRIWKKLE